MSRLARVEMEKSEKMFFSFSQKVHGTVFESQTEHTSSMDFNLLPGSQLRKLDIESDRKVSTAPTTHRRGGDSRRCRPAGGLPCPQGRGVAPASAFHWEVLL